jgi:hypothetical protein
MQWRHSQPRNGEGTRSAMRWVDNHIMEPVEINAGQWYLRGLRADSRIDDRPALAKLGVTDPGHVVRSNSQWAADTSYSWAVCEVTTGELLAEVTLDPVTGEIATRVRAGHADVATAAAESVRRFAVAIAVPARELELR